MSGGYGIAVYLDPPSRHFLGDRLFDIDGAAHGGDQLLAPYVFLKERLNERGIEIHTADLMPDAPDGSRNLYFSLGRLDAYRKLAKRPDTVLSAFVAMECPTVEPSLYRTLNRAQNFFKRVFSWSDADSLEPFVGGRLRCQPMRWPQSFDAVHEEIWRRTDRRFLVLINGNKVPRFRGPCRELYSERMGAIEYFGGAGDLDLYGVGWEGPPFKVGTLSIPGTFDRVRVPGIVSRMEYRLRTQWQKLFPDRQLTVARQVYRGFAASKRETLGHYKFAVCFENSVLKGWITEKIFDCFFAGTVPLYWGAPDIEDHIPAECFIDMRRFKDFADAKAFLTSLSGSDIDTYKENARAFLRSPRYRPFTRQAFAELFLRIVEEDGGCALPLKSSLSVARA